MVNELDGVSVLAPLTNKADQILERRFGISANDLIVNQVLFPDYKPGMVNDIISGNALVGCQWLDIRAEHFGGHEYIGRNSRQIVIVRILGRFNQGMNDCLVVLGLLLLNFELRPQLEKLDQDLIWLGLGAGAHTPKSQTRLLAGWRLRVE